nr:TIGR02757 family protein [Treponema sp.]
MDEKLKETLRALAEKYETEEFIDKDPSKFMHQIDDRKNQELVAFLSANLAFGKREQILGHIQLILDRSGNDMAKWIGDGKFRDFFPDNEKSFYRTYSNKTMLLFFETLKGILEESETLGEHARRTWESEKEKSGGFLHLAVAGLFPKECTLLPHSADSAAKKVNMFLRWMCRTDSPVDLGLWTWHDRRKLLIPLDTHVMQEATRFNLIEANSKGKTKGANLKTAVELTEKLSEVFPDDPVKGDFALFGLGVDGDRQSSTLG